MIQEFNEFFNEKISDSNKLFDDIQQLIDNIGDAEDNWKEKRINRLINVSSKTKASYFCLLRLLLI